MEEEDWKHSRFGSALRRLIARPTGLETQAMLKAVRQSVLGAAVEPLEVGKYRILRRVGAGGMGVVYEAYDPELQRHVALKVVRTSALHVASSHLLREARAIAKLAHPNVVAVYEAGSVGEETYVAMELVRGGDLAGWQQQKRPWRAILSAYRQAGEGLAAAHRIGLVHGDFKPQNALIDQEGRVRVADFGLARFARAASESSVTGSGSTFAAPGGDSLVGGTPRYMAPEQHAGARSTELSDEFAFAVALFEALYGEHPFGSDAAGPAQMSVGRVTARPKAPGVPGWIQKVLLRALARDPAARWPSMVELLRELARDPIRRRNRWLWAGAGTAVAVAALGSQQYKQAQRAAACADLRTELDDAWGPARQESVRAAIVSTQQPFAPAVWHQVESILSKYADRWVTLRGAACEIIQTQSGQPAHLAAARINCLEQRRDEMAAVVSALAGPGQDVALLALEATSSLMPLAHCENDRPLADEVQPLEDPALAERARLARRQIAESSALRRLGIFDPARELAEKALQTANALDYLPLKAEATFGLGALLLESGEARERGAELVEQAVWQGTAAKHDRVVALAASKLMVRLALWGHPADAQRWRGFAEAAVQRVGLGGIEDAYFQNDLGIVLHERGDLEESTRRLQSAIALKAALLGEEHSEVAKSLNNLALVHEEAGEFDVALQVHARARKIVVSLLGSAHPMSGLVHGNTGMLLALAGRLDEATRELDQSLAILEHSTGSDHAWYSVVLMGRCRVQLKRAQFEPARLSCLRAIELCSKSFGAQSSMVAESQTLLAAAYAGSQQLAEARTTIDLALLALAGAPTRSARLAEAKFTSARILWETPQDRKLADQRASEALSGFRAAGPGWQASGNEVESWRREHCLNCERL